MGKWLLGCILFFGLAHAQNYKSFQMNESGEVWDAAFMHVGQVLDFDQRNACDSSNIIFEELSSMQEFEGAWHLRASIFIGQERLFYVSHVETSFMCTQSHVFYDCLDHACLKEHQLEDCTDLEREVGFLNSQKRSTSDLCSLIYSEPYKMVCQRFDQDQNRRSIYLFERMAI